MLNGYTTSYRNVYCNFVFNSNRIIDYYWFTAAMLGESIQLAVIMTSSFSYYYYHLSAHISR